MKNLTIKQAIVKVLEEEAKPLTIKEIFSQILAKEYYCFKAQDPLNIVKVEIRRHCKGVEFPSAHPNKIFQILSDGKYYLASEPMLNKSDTVLLENKVDYHSISCNLKKLYQDYLNHFKQSILLQLKKIEPDIFEIFCKKLLEVYGFKDLIVTRVTKDGGIDGYGKLKLGISFLNVAFQCKRWTNHKVGREEVDKFRGAIQGDFEQGIFFTTSSFSKEAKEASLKKGAVPIILIDGNLLIEIMIDKNFGINVESLPLYINEIDLILND